MDVTFPDVSLDNCTQLALNGNDPRYRQPEWVYPRSSQAGVAVHEENATGIAHLWRGGNLLAGVVASLPIDVFKRLPQDRGKQPDEMHPSRFRIRRKANDAWTTYQWVYRSMWDAILHGNWYSLIRRDRMGGLQLIRLEPHAVSPPDLNRSHYLWTQPNGRQIPVSPDDMFHVTRFTRDGVNGVGLLDVARETLGSAIKGRDSAARYYRDGIQTTHAIKEPRPLSGDPLKNARKEIREEVNTNVGGVLLLTGGREIQNLGLKPADMQLLEGRQFNAAEIAAFLNLPIHLVGIDTQTRAFASLEMESQSFLDWSVNPWLVAIETQANCKLLRVEEMRRDTHVIEYDRQALIRVDTAALTALITSLKQNALADSNEIRGRYLNMNWRPDGEGLERQTDPSPRATSDEDPPPRPAEPDAELAKNARELALSAVRRLCSRMYGELGRVTKRGENAVEWLQTGLEPAFGRLALDECGPALAVLGSLDVPGLFDAFRQDALAILENSPSQAVALCDNRAPLLLEKIS